MTAPAMKTSPSVGCSKPEIILKMVVLPHPLGPRREKNSPFSMVNETSFTAAIPPNRLETFFSSTSIRVMNRFPLVCEIPYEKGKFVIRYIPAITSFIFWFQRS